MFGGKYSILGSAHILLPYILYSGKFSYGANFHIFRMCPLYAKIKTTKIWPSEIFATLKTMCEP